MTWRLRSFDRWEEVMVDFRQQFILNHLTAVPLENKRVWTTPVVTLEVWRYVQDREEDRCSWTVQKARSVQRKTR